MLPDATSATDYGLPKSNRSFVTDPRTEFDYSEIEAALVDIAALTRTCPRAWARINATSGVPVLVSHDSVWGNDDAVKPTITHNGDGDDTIAWPATVTDLNPTVARRVTRNLDIKTGWLSLHSAITNDATYGVTFVDSHTVRVYMFDASTPANYEYTVFVL